MRPGPTALAAGLNPGGVIIHVYGVPSQRLLVVRVARDQADVAAHASADAAAADRAMDRRDRGVCLVAYDGDTGERMSWHG